jgi:dihydroorotase
VVLEHITTREAVEFIERTGPNVAATITAHHLLLNRNAMFTGGIRCRY